MRTAIDMLTQMDYTLAGIGENAVPATILLDNEPIGFLMSDFSLKLLPEYVGRQASMEKAIDFALEYQDLETIEQEFKLTQYKDVMLAVDYDFEEQAPIYKIYDCKEGENILLHSTYSKDEATRDYAVRSGLTPGEVPSAAPSLVRLEKFINTIKEKGYFLSDKVRDTSRAYEIFDKNGKLVGYIDKANRITLATDNARTRQFLTNAYQSGSTQQPSLPPFFSALKERLAVLGLVLKQLFSHSGRSYAIQDQGRDIAFITQDRKIEYTPQATSERVKQIDAMIAQIERENAARAAQTQEATAPEAAMPETTASEAAMPEAAMPETTAPETAHTPPLGRALSAAEKTVSDNFSQHLQLLSTLHGFNPEQAEHLTQTMTERFGTTDPVKFAQLLQRGAFAEPKKLADRLRQGKERAAVENARTAPPLEKSQGKEHIPVNTQEH